MNDISKPDYHVVDVFNRSTENELHMMIFRAVDVYCKIFS